ncbi:MAG: DUF1427 family protein [Asticcacaulis sp.]
MPNAQTLKVAIGLVLGFGIGLGCRLGGIPSPAPPVLSGAMLVVAMTMGWILTDRWFATRPKLNAGFCAGPTGLPPSSDTPPPPPSHKGKIS